MSSIPVQPQSDPTLIHAMQKVAINKGDHSESEQPKQKPTTSLSHPIHDDTASDRLKTEGEARRFQLEATLEGKSELSNSGTLDAEAEALLEHFDQSIVIERIHKRFTRAAMKYTAELRKDEDGNCTMVGARLPERPVPKNAVFKFLVFKEQPQSVICLIPPSNPRRVELSSLVSEFDILFAGSVRFNSEHKISGWSNASHNDLYTPSESIDDLSPEVLKVLPRENYEDLDAYAEDFDILRRAGIIM